MAITKSVAYKALLTLEVTSPSYCAVDTPVEALEELRKYGYAQYSGPWYTRLKKRKAVDYYLTKKGFEFVKEINQRADRADRAACKL